MLYGAGSFFYNVCETISSPLTSDSMPDSHILQPDPARVLTNPADRPFIGVKFPYLCVEPTHYTLRHWSSDATHCLSSWEFQVCVCVCVYVCM